MRNKTHTESIEFWAAYIKEHKNWKQIHTRFINSQYAMHRRIMRKLSKMQKQALIDSYCKRQA